MKSFFWQKIAYSGGGYFRLYPQWFVRCGIRNSDYCMSYFHINDIVPRSEKIMDRASYEAYYKERGTLSNRMKRHFKSNVGKGKAMDRLFNLLDDFDFVSIDEAAKMEIVVIREL